MEKLTMKDELERGQGFAKQLERLILKSNDGEDDDHHDDDSSKTTSYAEDLAGKVYDSFTNTILIFNNIQHSHHVSADSLPANDSHNKSQQSSKGKSPTFFNNYGTTRSPKKRKSTQTWEEESKISPKKDEYAWRKYGQKNIINAKHPRNYYRCSHKYQQGCEATKQVQRIQDDPPLFKTTYFGYHTCSNNNPHMFDNSNDISTSSSMISFHNNTSHNTNTAFDLQKSNNSVNFLSSMTFPNSIDDNDNNNNKDNDDNNKNSNVPSPSWNDDWLLSPNEALPVEYDDHVDVNSSAMFHNPGIRHNNNNNKDNHDDGNNVPSCSWDDDRLLSPDDI